VRLDRSGGDEEGLSDLAVAHAAGVMPSHLNGFTRSAIRVGDESHTDLTGAVDAVNGSSKRQATLVTMLSQGSSSPPSRWKGASDGSRVARMVST